MRTTLVSHALTHVSTLCIDASHHATSLSCIFPTPYTSIGPLISLLVVAQRCHGEKTQLFFDVIHMR